ncbi:DUF4833 domain-containing protein [Runella aurantiaca]|uniref:DUF4833 domain-containing protein n=1 Tax=Runella aurantiaca TaxID=2282308 RepID=A0A369I3D0_9BACT|nr:DUF4833 domain-containing protein [Runella aurantiaca]RDB04301.1 DUF4833 domain-containing protein [Runella aurantiaca]
MKIYTLIFAAMGLCSFHAVDDSPKISFPEPPTSANHLFYIQRSNDANTVMYDANLLPNKRLNPKFPIDVYWIRYAEKGQREKLSAVQWQLAYGYKQHINSKENESVVIRLNAFQNRSLQVLSHEGKPAAITQIDGHASLLRKIFVQLEPSGGFIPKVRYIELFGITMHPNKHAVSERIYVNR